MHERCVRSWVARTNVRHESKELRANCDVVSSLITFNSYGLNLQWSVCELLQAESVEKPYRRFSDAERYSIYAPVGGLA